MLRTLMPLLLPVGGLLAQTTLHVPAQFATVQAALDVATAGDTVQVAAGTYAGNLQFPGRDIALRGAGPERTVLQGTGFEPVITCNPGSTRLAVLEGFTIRGGNGFDAGGIFVNRCSPTIRGNHVVANRTSARGGGIGVQFGSPRIEGNRIADNTQSFNQVSGGGIHLLGAGSAEIVGNVIERNQAIDGGGIGLFAAGTPRIEDNRILGNSATRGGGLSFTNDSAALLLQNVITGNLASQGGGIYHTNGAVVAVNNTFVANSGQGSAVWVLRPLAVLTFVNNLMSGSAPLLFGDGWRPEITHTFTHNLLSAPTVFGGSWPDWTGNPGVVVADPRLRSDGLQLAADSPARDAGTPRPELPVRDFLGDPRVVAGIVDLGADEYAGRFPFGTACGAPAIAAASGGLPELGNATFAFDLSGGLPGGAAMFVLGDSSTQWNGQPLPASLAPYGLPACQQLVSALHWVLLPCDQDGRASTGCPLPTETTLRGTRWFGQWVTFAGPLGQPGRLAAASGGLLVELF